MNNVKLDNIDTSFESYQQLINLYSECKNIYFSDIEIEISKWFAANLSSPLGGVVDKLVNNLNDIKFKTEYSIERILKKNNFLSHFGYDKINDSNNTTIEYLKLKPSDSRYFHEYIINELINRKELPEMSNELNKKISESIFEIFTNAQIHSQSDFIYVCGQFFPAKHKIEFTITDMGIGFKNIINNRFKKGLSSTQAIDWAINDGNSTKKNVTGGIGLAILKEFIIENKGKFQIISDDGFYQLSNNHEEKKLFKNKFPGTIINMQFRTNDRNSYSSIDVINDLF